MMSLSHPSMYSTVLALARLPVTMELLDYSYAYVIGRGGQI